MINSKSWLGLIVFISWLSQIVYLFPLPSAMPVQAIANEAKLAQNKLDTVPEVIELDKIKKYSEQAEDEIWDRWILHATLILFGIIASVLAFKQVAFWRTAIILTSLCYLVIMYDPGYVDKVGLLEAYKLKWKLYSSFNDLQTFVHRDFVLPIFYLATVIILPLHKIREGKKTR